MWFLGCRVQICMRYICVKILQCIVLFSCSFRVVLAWYNVHIQTQAAHLLTVTLHFRCANGCRMDMTRLKVAESLKYRADTKMKWGHHLQAKTAWQATPNVDLDHLNVKLCERVSVALLLVITITPNRDKCQPVCKILMISPWCTACVQNRALLVNATGTQRLQRDSERLILNGGEGFFQRCLLSSVQSSEQPVNSPFHYLKFPLWAQYQKFRAIECWWCGFINYWSHWEHLLIMIPAEELLVRRDTGAVKEEVEVERGQAGCDAHMGPRYRGPSVWFKVVPLDGERELKCFISASSHDINRRKNWQITFSKYITI